MDKHELARLQAQIDAIDADLVDLLKRRFARSRRIGELKREAAQPPLDPTRIATQTDAFVRQGAAAGLEPVMARQLISLVLAQVVTERLSPP